MEKITLYEEYRLVERSETEINTIWKGAHLLLFFLAFVFGSFCTFCFHMLMYLFDEKCVLFPKLLFLTTLRQNIIYEFMPEDREEVDIWRNEQKAQIVLKIAFAKQKHKDGKSHVIAITQAPAPFYWNTAMQHYCLAAEIVLPVDFLNTQWVEKSACYLPTYVPLVSGIFGLVWTTMFLMCSTGSRVLTGLQRPWRVLPPVFLFSLAMGALCVYTSVVTHYGLEELCLKLSEIAGSNTCSFTVNVATLAYERRIRGVYQATRLTIVSAWLHTMCWLLSAVLAVARVVLAVDFQLVRVRAQLRGDVDRMLERHELQLGTVSPDYSEPKKPVPVHYSRSSVKVHFKKRELQSRLRSTDNVNVLQPADENGGVLYFSDIKPELSESSLEPIECQRLERLAAYSCVPKNHRFIVKLLFDMLATIDLPESPPLSVSSSTSTTSFYDSKTIIVRQYGQQRITSELKHGPDLQVFNESLVALEEAEAIARDIKRQLQSRLNQNLSDLQVTPYQIPITDFESTMDVAFDNKVQGGLSESQKNIGTEPSTSKKQRIAKKLIKSNLKHVGVQTKKRSVRVQIDQSTEKRDSSDTSVKQHKETQTKKEKED